MSFKGCAVHGCPKCILNRDLKLPLADGKTAREAYEATMRREDELKQQGYQLTTIWEHDYYIQLAFNQDMRNHIKAQEYIVDPLDPRLVFILNFKIAKSHELLLQGWILWGPHKRYQALPHVHRAGKNPLHRHMLPL